VHHYFDLFEMIKKISATSDWYIICTASVI